MSLFIYWIMKAAIPTSLKRVNCRQRWRPTVVSSQFLLMPPTTARRRNNGRTYTGRCRKPARRLCDPGTALYPSADHVWLATQTDIYSNRTVTWRKHSRTSSSKRTTAISCDIRIYSSLFSPLQTVCLWIHTLHRPTPLAFTISVCITQALACALATIWLIWNFLLISAKLLLKHTPELVLYTSVSYLKTETS